MCKVVPRIALRKRVWQRRSGLSGPGLCYMAIRELAAIGISRLSLANLCNPKLKEFARVPASIRFPNKLLRARLVSAIQNADNPYVAAATS